MKKVNGHRISSWNEFEKNVKKVARRRKRFGCFFTLIWLFIIGVFVAILGYLAIIAFYFLSYYGVIH